MLYFRDGPPAISLHSPVADRGRYGGHRSTEKDRGAGSRGDVQDKVLGTMACRGKQSLIGGLSFRSTGKEMATNGRTFRARSMRD